VNPDSGFGMQVTIEESLADIPTVCFQAAVLYTSSKSERRIRIHTYCLPVTKSINEIVNGADQEAVIGLIAKMGN
jgi:protein transport protein SEC24